MMSLPLAEALIPGAYVETFDAVRDFRALYTLAVWCLRFSPLVGLDTEIVKARAREELPSVSALHYGITIDLTGTEKIHGDYAAFCKHLAALFRDTARIAVAPTIGGAWGLSRYGTNSLIIASSHHALTDALKTLPTLALRIDPSCAELLADVGIYTIGDLLSLPRHTLGQRFGKLLVYRLHQALGDLEERLLTVEAPAHHERSKIFEPPLTHRRAITHAIEHLFRELASELSSHSITAKHFALTIRDTSSHSFHKEFPLASATNDQKHLLSILQPIIDSLRFSAEVREILLRAQSTERTTHKQRTFTNSRHDSLDVERSHKELLNTFSVRLGKDRILRATLHDSYLPERSFSYQSALNQTKKQELAVNSPIVPYNLRERPSMLFARPEAIRTIAMLPDRPPSFIQWRNVHLTIRSGFGPERIAPEWWHDLLQKEIFAERDYFTIQDDSGRWLWVYRDRGTQKWFVHGVWT